MLGDRLARRKERYRLLAPLCGGIVSAPLLAATLLAPSAIAAILWHAVPATGCGPSTPDSTRGACSVATVTISALR